MSTIRIEKKDVIKYIEGIFNKNKQKLTLIKNARYHHNSHYDTASLICEQGILTLSDLNSNKNRSDSKEVLEILDDISSHANGIDGVSLSVVGLDDLYRDEDEYDPYKPDMVDFLLSDDVKTRRYSINYGNEFIADGSIAKEMIMAVDIRFQQLIDRLEDTGASLDEIIKKFNYLIDIACSLEKSTTQIPLRQISKFESYDINTHKLAESPKILLK